MIQVKPTDKLVFDLEMLQVDYDEQKKNVLKKEIAEKYGVPLKNVEINFVPITLTEEGDKITLTSDITSNIQDPQFQQDLFAKYIKMNKIEDVDLDQINEIDNDVNLQVDFNAYAKYKAYKLKYLKWSNYLSYGPDNYYDFTNLRGLVLLNGYPENQCGKTTFAVDLLRFALFGKAKKSPTLESVFNGYLPEATECIVEACIEIENVDYVIRRTITRPALAKRTKKSKAKQKVEYFKKINGDYELIENCEAESATQTNNIIREAVGTIEDYNLVISANATSLAQLLEMGQTDRSRLFSKWLGLLSIEEKEKIAKDTYKLKVNPRLLSNRYDKATLMTEVQTSQETIKENNKLIKECQKKLKDSNTKLENLNKDKTAILATKKEVKEELIKMDVTTIENKKKMQEEELERKRIELGALKQEYETLKNVTFDEPLLKQKREAIRQLEAHKTELRVNIGHLREDNTRIEGLIAKKICPTCGQKIDTSSQTAAIERNNLQIKAYTEEGVKCKEQGEKIEKEIEELEQNRKNVEQLEKLKLKMVAVKTQLDNCKLLIAEAVQKLKDIEANKDNIRYNNEVETKIRNLDESIRVETSIKDQLIRDSQAYESENKTLEKAIGEKNETIGKLTQEETLIRNWKVYIDLLGKNGIIKLVLKEALPIINNEIARILNGLVDFNVELGITEDNKVCMDFIRDGVRFDLTYASSGFETVMASLALRMALSLIGNMPKVNILVLDEIIGPVGASNFDNLRELFNRILTHYDVILHITHETSADDWHSKTITVQKKDNVSFIAKNE